ncbi:MAG: hypothetical protein ACE5HB_10160 [Terriglobia bacterium]
MSSNKQDSKKQPKQAAASGKRPYSRPVLKPYGTLREVVRGGSQGGGADGQAGGSKAPQGLG